MSRQMCTHSFRSSAEPSSRLISGSPVGDRLMMPSRAPLSSSSCSTCGAGRCGEYRHLMRHLRTALPCAARTYGAQEVGMRTPHMARLRHGVHVSTVLNRGVALRHCGQMRHAHVTQASEERPGGGSGPEQARRKADG